MSSSNPAHDLQDHDNAARASKTAKDVEITVKLLSMSKGIKNDPVYALHHHTLTHLFPKYSISDRCKKARARSSGFFAFARSDYMVREPKSHSILREPNLDDKGSQEEEDPGFVKWMLWVSESFWRSLGFRRVGQSSEGRWPSQRRKPWKA
ncbi:hypothetical protein IMZ48_05265 [Candidatus Bathyarchaeota archaeon]|nr:hypothetical protein [Candidatus Bathyarchaeota archaeon]